MAAVVPEGFSRVELSDMDHLGMFVRRGRGFMDYWSADAPGVVRREKALGSTGRQITTVRLRVRSARP